MLCHLDCLICLALPVWTSWRRTAKCRIVNTQFMGSSIEKGVYSETSYLVVTLLQCLLQTCRCAARVCVHAACAVSNLAVVACSKWHSPDAACAGPSCFRQNEQQYRSCWHPGQTKGSLTLLGGTTSKHARQTRVLTGMTWTHGAS